MICSNIHVTRVGSAASAETNDSMIDLQDQAAIGSIKLREEKKGKSKIPREKVGRTNCRLEYKNAIRKVTQNYHSRVKIEWCVFVFTRTFWDRGYEVNTRGASSGLA